MSKSQDRFEKETAKKLLMELDTIKASDREKLRSWKIKAQTLLVFAEIRRQCSLTSK